MKKILLAFLGMLFFAHLSYATYYKIERGDWAGANLVKNYSNTSYNAYEMIDMYVNVDVKKYCWEGGGDGSKEDRRAIYCPIGDYEKFGGTDEGGYSTHFWKEARCKDYVNDIYYQNTSKPRCVKVNVGPEYNVYEIESPGAGWWWNKGNASGTQPKGAWVHNVRIHEAFDGYTNIYDGKLDGVQKKNGEWVNDLEWIGYASTASGEEFNLSGTVLTTDAAVAVLKANPIPCLNYAGYPLGNKKQSYYTFGGARFIVTRENCPTSLDGKAFVEYFSQQGCRDAITRNGGAAMAEGSSGSCKEYVQRRYFTVNSGGKYPSKGDNYQERSYASTSFIFRCKNYYNTWEGTRKNGHCQGYYTHYRKNSNGSMETNFTAYTDDVTKIKTYAEGSYSMFVGRLSCTASRASHDETPGAASVTCTCGSNKFWSKSSCEAAFTNEPMQYCQENTSAGGVCAWEMKNCADLGADRFKYKSDCQYKRNKSNRILTHECKNTGAAFCPWEVTSVTNTVSKCNGNSDYIGKDSNGRYCYRKKAK